MKLKCVSWSNWPRCLVLFYWHEHADGVACEKRKIGKVSLDDSVGFFNPFLSALSPGGQLGQVTATSRVFLTV